MQPLHLLAQQTDDPQQTLLEAYGLIVLIAAVGLAAVIMVISMMVARRMARRRIVLLERSIEKRRAEQGPPPGDAWQAGADRYVDPDRLSPEEIAERAAGGAEDEPGDDSGPLGPTWDTPAPGDTDSDPGEDDPFGLFEDKPYVDPDPDEDDEDPGDEVDPDEPWR
jgi:hypothetical protein